MVTTAVFYVFAAALVAAALGVVTVRNPVHAAMCLVLSFATSAVLWILLEAEFLGVALVLVYVGAVMVLFLFVVMMLDINVERLREGFTRYAPLGLLVAFAVAAQIGYVIVFHRPAGGTALPPGAGPEYSNTKELGAVLYTDFVYPFELAAMVLLVAIVAAIALTMRRRPGLKPQNVSRQIATRRDERVRLVSLKAEGKQ